MCVGMCKDESNEASDVAEEQHVTSKVNVCKQLTLSETPSNHSLSKSTVPLLLLLILLTRLPVLALLPLLPLLLAADAEARDIAPLLERP
jgi:hypothetical protein